MSVRMAAISAALVLAITFSTTFAQADDATKLRCLEGGARVSVEKLPDSVTKYGVTDEKIKTLITFALLKNGIKALSDNSTAPLILVRVVSGDEQNDLIYSIQLSVVDSVILARDAAQHVEQQSRILQITQSQFADEIIVAAIWSTFGLGKANHQRLPNDLYGGLTSRIDELIQDYLKVHNAPFVERALPKRSR